MDPGKLRILSIPRARLWGNYREAYRHREVWDAIDATGSDVSGHSARRCRFLAAGGLAGPAGLTTGVPVAGRFGSDNVI